MIKDKIDCVNDISAGLPIATALKLYMLDEEFSADGAFKRRVFEAQRKFLMSQLENAQRVIDEDRRGAASLITYLIDRALSECADPGVDGNTDDAEVIDLDSEIMRVLADNMGVRVEYESGIDKKTVTNGYSDIPTKKHH